MSRETIPDLSRLYRAGALEEPPEWLDTQIEAAAGNALHSAGSLQRARHKRWYFPVALAAMVVLSSSIAWRIHMDGDPASHTDLGTKPSSVDPGRAPAAERSTTGLTEHIAEVGRSASSKSARALPSQSSRSIDAHTERAVATDNVPMAKEERTPTADRAPGAAPSGVLPDRAAAGSPAPRAAEPVAETAEGSAPSTPQRLDSMKRAEHLARNAKQEPAASMEGRPVAQLEHDPEAWLRHIVKLRREGHDEAARESLAAFRRRFPDHPVPDDLKQ